MDAVETYVADAALFFWRSLVQKEQDFYNMNKITWQEKGGGEGAGGIEKTYREYFPKYKYRIKKGGSAYV